MKQKNKKQKQAQSDESDPDNDHENKSEKSDNSNDQEINIDNYWKQIPVAKLPEKLSTKRIVANVSDTQYPIVQQVFEEMGWIIQRNQGSGDWDIWWTDSQIALQTLYKMNLHQKISHFPAIQVLARKNLLGLNLMAMRDQFPEEYKFFPETWVIPLQYPKFRSYDEANLSSPNPITYIVKPQAQSQGRGIFLTREIKRITNGRKYVIQKYIENPLLIDGLKFDLRIYIFLASTNPLKIYIHEEGLARFATKKYEIPNEENISSAYTHLTNYSLNKKNPQFIHNVSEEEMNVGHKRTLSSTYAYLEKCGHDVQNLKNKIDDLTVKTIISGFPTISHKYSYSQPQQQSSSMCFHILGIDVMITSQLQPYLIQINHTPSFQTSTPLDYKVKKSVIKDALNIMNINENSKQELFQKAKFIMKRRIETGKRDFVRDRAMHNEMAEETHNDIEETGGYKKIFPVANTSQMEKYKKMISHSEIVHKQTYETRRKLIIQQQERVKEEKKAAQLDDKKDPKSLKALKEKNQSRAFTKLKIEQAAQTNVVPVRHHSRSSSPKPEATFANSQLFEKTDIQLSYPNLQKQLYIGHNKIRSKLKRNYQEGKQESKLNGFLPSFLSPPKKSHKSMHRSIEQIDEIKPFNQYKYKNQPTTLKKLTSKSVKDPALSLERSHGIYITPKIYEIANSRPTVVASKLLPRYVPTNSAANIGETTKGNIIKIGSGIGLQGHQAKKLPSLL